MKPIVTHTILGQKGDIAYMAELIEQLEGNRGLVTSKSYSDWLIKMVAVTANLEPYLGRIENPTRYQLNFIIDVIENFKALYPSYFVKSVFKGVKNDD